VIKTVKDHWLHDQSLANLLSDMMQFVINYNVSRLLAYGCISYLQTFFLRKTIFNKMFHSDYKHITDRLSESLIKRAYERFLHYSKDSVLLESISEKSEWIESYLRHTLEVYENLLNRKKHKTMTQKNTLRPQSWPECNVSPALLTIHVVDNEVQTDNSV